MFTFDITIQRRRTRHIQFEIRTHAARGHTADGGTCIVHSSRTGLRSSRDRTSSSSIHHDATDAQTSIDMLTCVQFIRLPAALVRAHALAELPWPSHLHTSAMSKSPRAKTHARQVCAPHYSCATAVAQAATVPSCAARGVVSAGKASLDAHASRLRRACTFQRARRHTHHSPTPTRSKQALTALSYLSRLGSSERVESNGNPV